MDSSLRKFSSPPYSVRLLIAPRDLSMTQRFGYTMLEFHARGFEIWLRTKDNLKL